MRPLTVFRYNTAGLKAYEQAISFTAGKYSFGNSITIADLCLVPALLNARQFGVDMSQLPNICRVEAELSQHPAFQAAHPDVQPDKPQQ